MSAKRYGVELLRWPDPRFSGEKHERYQSRGGGLVAYLEKVSKRVLTKSASAARHSFDVARLGQWFRCYTAFMY